MSGRLAPLIERIGTCRLCAGCLPHEPRPVVQAGETAKLLIVGQAPGRRVHETGIPWNDASGKLLREWLGMAPEQFYDSRLVAIVPTAFCYPGKGASGDLPPRPECAPQWHAPLLQEMPQVQLTLLIGSYAQAWYLKGRNKKSLTENIAAFRDYLPRFFPLPHPSPRNRLWLKRNPWFEQDVLPALRDELRRILSAPSLAQPTV